MRSEAVMPGESLNYAELGNSRSEGAKETGNKNRAIQRKFIFSENSRCPPPTFPIPINAELKNSIPLSQF